MQYVFPNMRTATCKGGRTPTPCSQGFPRPCFETTYSRVIGDRGEWSGVRRSGAPPAHEGRSRMAGNDFPLVTTFVNPEPDHTHTRSRGPAASNEMTNLNSQKNGIGRSLTGGTGRSICCPQNRAEGETGQSGNPTLGRSRQGLRDHYVGRSDGRWMNRPSAEFEGAILTKTPYTLEHVPGCVNRVMFYLSAYWERNLSSVPQHPN